MPQKQIFTNHFPFNTIIYLLVSFCETLFVHLYIQVMKVHLVKRQSIEDFISKNARSRSSFEAWIAIVKRVDML